MRQHTGARSERFRPLCETSTVLRNALVSLRLFGQNQVVEQRRAVHDLGEILRVIEHFTQFRRQFGAMRVLPRERHIVVASPLRDKLRKQRAGAGRAQADALSEIFGFAARQAQGALFGEILRRRN